MKVAVTGVAGFLGTDLANLLLRQGYQVRGILRRTLPDTTDLLISDFSVMGDIGSTTSWGEALKGIDVVVHLAARVHIMNENKHNTKNIYHQVNTAGTETLALESANIGIKRFIYVSTVKVNGEKTTEKSFTENDIPSPVGYYAQSKLESEKIIMDIGKKSGMETVIVRPPLIYGPGVKANFLKLIKLVESGIILPFKSIYNLRSMIYLENMSNFLINCIEKDSAAGQIFLVSDGWDLSTPQLINSIAACLEVTPRLYPFPVSMIKIMGKITGQNSAINRLTDSLRVDISKAKNILSWIPPYTPEQGIEKTINWYLNKNNMS